MSPSGALANYASLMTVASGSATPQFDFSTGDLQSMTLTVSATGPTFVNASRGQFVVVSLIQDATGGRTWTWPSTVIGSPPTPNPAANSRSDYIFRFDGTNYIWLGGDYNPAAAGGSTGNWTEADQTLVASGAVTLNMNNGNVQQVTLGATTPFNATSSSITNAVKGQILVLTLVQGTTGGATWAWFANVKWRADGGAPYMDTKASTQQTFVFRYDGTNWIHTSGGLPNPLPGTELGYADVAANISVTTTEADAAGLSITVTAPSRPFYVEALLALPQITDLNLLAVFISDGSNTHLVEGATPGAGGSFNDTATLFVRVRLPNANYSITPGNSYTFKVRVVSVGASGTFQASAADRSYIAAIAA